MFLSNVANIDAAITNKVAEVVDFCEANGLELGSPEAAIALHKEFDMWAIAKGIIDTSLKVDGVHGNYYFYYAVAKAIYEKGVSLNYWE